MNVYNAYYYCVCEVLFTESCLMFVAHSKNDDDDFCTIVFYSLRDVRDLWTQTAALEESEF